LSLFTNSGYAQWARTLRLVPENGSARRRLMSGVSHVESSICTRVYFRSRLLVVNATLALLFLLAVSDPAFCKVRRGAGAERISAAEFSRLVRDLSEDGGYFRSDNFTSNETSYLHVVSKLKQLAPSGGAYVGVGP